MGIVRMPLVYTIPNNRGNIDLSCSHCMLADLLSAVLNPRNLITADLENAIAILCPCLPTYGPILSRSGAAFSRLKKRYPLRTRSIGRGGLAWKIESDQGTKGEDQEPIRDLYPRPANEYPLKNIPSGNLSNAQDPAVAQENYVLDISQGTKAAEVV